MRRGFLIRHQPTLITDPIIRAPSRPRIVTPVSGNTGLSRRSADGYWSQPPQVWIQPYGLQPAALILRGWRKVLYKMAMYVTERCLSNLENRRTVVIFVNFVVMACYQILKTSSPPVSNSSETPWGRAQRPRALSHGQHCLLT